MTFAGLAPMQLFDERGVSGLLASALEMTPDAVYFQLRSTALVGGPPPQLTAEYRVVVVAPNSLSAGLLASMRAYYGFESESLLISRLLTFVHPSETGTRNVSGKVGTAASASSIAPAEAASSGSDTVSQSTSRVAAIIVLVTCVAVVTLVSLVALQRRHRFGKRDFKRFLKMTMVRKITKLQKKRRTESPRASIDTAVSESVMSESASDPGTADKTKRASPRKVLFAASMSSSSPAEQDTTTASPSSVVASPSTGPRGSVQLEARLEA
eukprot:m.559718 g.559718  ORF g.559718 m.559718 type:complete len:269 (-) comp57777_c0_seq16:100-906(-)